MKKVNKNHVYSYTQLELFENCPYAYYLKLSGSETVDNNFALLGSLVHDILDKWAKHEITAEEMPIEFEERFPVEVNLPWPAFLKNKWRSMYDKCLAYLESFDEFKDYNVLDSEVEFKIKVAGRKFTGFIDMILEDKNTGEMIILDHKSKSKRAFKEAEDTMYRQPLIYATYIKEKYGKYPDLIGFNLFKEGGQMVLRAFKEDDYNEAIDWASSVMDKIESYEEMDYLMDEKSADKNSDGRDMYCNEICSYRCSCPNSNGW